MKLSVFAALIGVAFASQSEDLTTLPEWKVNPQCKGTLQNDASDITAAIKKMPMAVTANSTEAEKQKALLHRKAVIAVAKYFRTIDASCHDTADGFYCPNSSQHKIKGAYVEMSNALTACHSAEANKLRSEIIEFFRDLTNCSTMVNDDEILIKVTLPPVGQHKLESEWEDVEIQLKKLKANPHWHKIRAQLQ